MGSPGRVQENKAEVRGGTEGQCSVSGLGGRRRKSHVPEVSEGRGESVVSRDMHGL